MKRKSRARHAVPAATAAAVLPQGKPQVANSTVSPPQSAEDEGRRIANPRSQEAGAEGQRMENLGSQGAQERIHVPEEVKGLVAEVMLGPEMSAALSMNGMMGDCLIEAGIDATTVSEMLTNQGAAVVDGDLAQARRSLAAQAATLERMFHHLFRIATVAEKHSTDLYERYLRLALRAQSQAMRTLHVMGRLGGREPAARQPSVRQKGAPSTEVRSRSPSPAAGRMIAPVPPPLSPSPVGGLASNPMPAGGWRSLARIGARWAGGWNAPKR